jgi:hypothetical protein
MNLKEIINDQSPKRNLINSLYALGFAALASLASFMALDSFVPGGGSFMIRLWVVLYFALTIVSGVLAFVACRNSLKNMKTNKDNRNYIAFVIGGFLFLGICRLISNHI